MTTENEIEAIVKTVAEKYEITNATKELTDAEALAKHYVGELIPVIVRGQKNGQDITLYAIIKVPQGMTDDPLGEEMIEQFFTKEISAYSILLPAFKVLQQEVAIANGFTFIECYHHNTEPKKKMLVLQDMRQRGYNVYKQTMFMDIDHVTEAIKEVAKFHALSFTLQHLQPEEFAKLSEHFTPMEENKNFSIFAEILLASVKRDTEKLSAENKKRLRSCYPAMTQEALRNAGTKRVICHNDLWRNNILFKYLDSKPISACLLDYQLAQVANPAADLLSLISACTEHNVRRLYYEHLLCTYHQTLANTLTSFSIDVADIYTFEELKEDLKAVAPMSLLRSIFGLQTWFGTGGINDLPDVKIKDSGEAVEGTVGLDVSVQAQQAAEHLIADFAEYGYVTE